ncbi:MAG: helix-turn-helix transcriptional regulator [Myxococcales bacterium]|nr:helix-turn-helix transcriptional regulator [Myxococcales bacterium]
MTDGTQRRLVEGRGFVVGAFVCPPSSPRWRSENEIQLGPLFVFPGVPVEIQQAGQTSVAADPNQVIFYNHAQRYTRRLLDARGDRCTFVGLDPADVRAALVHAGLSVGERPEAPFTFVRAPASAQVYLRHLAIERYALGETARDDLLIHEALLTILSEVVRGVPRERVRARAERHRRGLEAVHAAQVLLGTRFGEPWSLATLGAEVALSPFHLARLFREALGTTVHAYLEQLRLRAGLLRLADGERLVDVALDVGFSSHSHFTARVPSAHGAHATRGAGVARGARGPGPGGPEPSL